MILRFPVPDEPVGVNKSPRSRGGAIGWGKKRQKWRDTAYAYALDHPAAPSWPMGESYVQVTIPFAMQRARDPHNFTGSVVKWIIDGMVRAGVWLDDGPDYVTVLDPILVVGNEVVVCVSPRTVRVY